ncbi:hypothetical protein [Knoellia flava]|uniref:hypothetical protein n=2 Tax=Knoellia flava TaxID=913969 RepID=UPI001666F729|nr:hypothetical protein [Knoellia flava]
MTAAFSSLSRPTLVKGLVGLGLATSVAAAVAIPVQADPGQIELGSQTNAFVARDRAAATEGTTSRSSARASVAGSRAALTAPAAGQSAAVSAGPAGVTAVAKPAPKPKPKPTPTKTAEKAPEESESSSSREATTTAPASGSGVSMAFYGWCDDKGLGDNASKVCSAVRSNFGITNIGGYRAGAGDHGAGKAVDIMVTGSRGDAVAAWAIDNMSRYNMTYVIWKQRIWMAGASGWRAMEDRGSVTANHYDHVHISVE